MSVGWRGGGGGGVSPGSSASRYFALTEMDTDAEDEDSGGLLRPHQRRRSGVI